MANYVTVQLQRAATLAQVRKAAQSIINDLAQGVITYSEPPVTPYKTGRLARSRFAISTTGELQASAGATAPYAYWVHRKKPFLLDGATTSGEHLPDYVAKVKL